MSAGGQNPGDIVPPEQRKIGTIPITFTPEYGKDRYGTERLQHPFNDEVQLWANIMPDRDCPGAYLGWFTIYGVLDDWYIPVHPDRYPSVEQAQAGILERMKKFIEL